MPKVSAIIIFCNNAPFLEEAIDSVLKQSFRDWELLLVDDGSTDASTSIARKSVLRQPDRIFYFEHQNHSNRGTGESRNLGIEKATGEFLAFLDGDDVWLPRKIEEQVAIMRAHPTAAMVYGRTEIWRSWDPNATRPDRFYGLGVEPNTLVQPPGLLINLLLNQTQSPTTCNALFRRQIADEVGYFDADFKGMFEDAMFFSKLELSYPIFVSDACWARYRQHSASLCAKMTSTGQENATRIVFLKWLRRHLSSKGVSHPELHKVLRGRLWANKYPFLDEIPRRTRDFFHRIKQRVARLLPSKVRRSLKAILVRGIAREAR